MKLPTLNSEDVIALLDMRSTARLIEKYDLAYQRELAQVQRDLLKDKEKSAPVNARVWWFNASGTSA